MIDPGRQRKLDRLKRASGLGGLLALALCLTAAFFDAREFFRAYLFAYLFWLGLALGCFAIAMIHHLTGGRWGFVARRFLEAGFMTLPLLAILFIPIFFGLSALYPWARPAEVEASEILQQQRIYLNGPAFAGRAIFYFALWISIAWFLRRWSLEQDRTGSPEPTRRLRALSGAGLVVYPLTATFAFVDWVMSTEAEWYSTIFSLLVLVGQVLSAFALVIVLMALFENHPGMGRVVSGTHFHHLGNLMLAFVLVWTYVNFSQLLIIYSGNLPHEIHWYQHRAAGGWKWVVVFLAVFHFLVPFFMLLFRSTKTRGNRLVFVAALVLAAHLINVWWIVVPSFHPDGIRLHWLDFAAPLGIGGLWLAAFLFNLKGPALLPRNDPRMEYSFADGT